MPTALESRLKSLIRDTGPISVAEYMTFCLLDPVNGFYPTRDPLGSEGDFITAPEISQMFGEVLGLFVLQSWIDLGKPEQIYLIELGPGRGVMMADMLRAANLDKDFAKAVTVILIEASAALEAVQGQTLGQTGVMVQWAKSLDDVPAGPSIIIGNEFLDCLPIRQFIQRDPFAKENGWHERYVGLDDSNNLRFEIGPEPASETAKSFLPKGHVEAKLDDLIEACPAAHQIIDTLKLRFEADKGRALFIDYGPETTEFGDTLQALKRHKKIGVFEQPGESDLTARVDFEALSDNALSQDLSVNGPIPQRELLSKLGLEMRAVALARAKPEAKSLIARQLHRLTDQAEMGELFKAICLQSKDLPTPLGFRET
ncbi:NADH dehydrogenase [ubiquinone] 1 alpha subcomplex assembly factor 7 [Litorimonas taeanensis]|uniref:NADH dehydrogenase [ubiquinone] 1 alpha subcomplex assembly factor 7 n=1 Tax=Litorimonas taeanensis TaxID=568099 RepID=A0A420WJQ8_9PROT|nr:SAM-dependent methyltransferase [Litorimonas taeanensis]RKQ71238.1 NADH dehydrogenase [ubiquinone] 1 alpha subcomplex assembly factor 7 [Litorimonas taeanensis]